jgi:hypothetical protein
MAKKFEALRSKMPPEARARAAERAENMLVEMNSASLRGDVHRRRPDFLKIAATSASVSYKETIAPHELASILLSGNVPLRFRPHLRVILEELPPSALKGVVEQLSDRMSPEGLRKNLTAIARQVGISR